MNRGRFDGGEGRAGNVNDFVFGEMKRIGRRCRRRRSRLSMRRGALICQRPSGRARGSTRFGGTTESQSKHCSSSLLRRRRQHAEKEEGKMGKLRMAGHGHKALIRAGIVN